jgi:hypothetical protein
LGDGSGSSTTLYRSLCLRVSLRSSINSNRLPKGAGKKSVGPPSLDYGTSHVLSKDEAKFVFERGCEQLILGSGQMGNVHLSPEAEAYFAKKGCEVLLQPTPEAIDAFNRSHAKKIGLFHVTC